MEEPTWVFESSDPTPSDTAPLSRLYLLQQGHNSQPFLNSQPETEPETSHSHSNHQGHLSVPKQPKPALMNKDMSIYARDQFQFMKAV